MTSYDRGRIRFRRASTTDHCATLRITFCGDGRYLSDYPVHLPRRTNLKQWDAVLFHGDRQPRAPSRIVKEGRGE